MTEFKKFKDDLLSEGGATLPDDLIDRYGQETVEQTESLINNMTEEQWVEQERLQEQIASRLKQIVEIGDPGCDEARELVDLHRQWLEIWWPAGTYTPALHCATTKMYTETPEFSAIYDGIVPRGTEFLNAAVHIFANS